MVKFAQGKKFFGALTAILSLISTRPALAAQLPQRWLKVCSEQKGATVCNTVNTVLSDTGQPLTTVNVMQYPNSDKPPVLRIIVPTGRLIPQGVLVKIGDTPVKKANFVSCIGASCIADASIDRSIIEAMRKANQMVVTSTNFLGAENPITVSLKEFGPAIEGQSLTEEQYAAEQEKILAPLRGKIKTFDEQLKAAQEQAKQKNVSP